jgi:5-methyltetrahydropteroyltriglutamate--homocysteine methyltransferase
MCYGNAREFDCAYPEVNAACLAKLFASTREVGWREIHLETARPAMAEMELLAGWLDRADTALGIGVVEVMSPRVETAEDVAARIRTALQYVPADRLVVSTDCGLYQLPRDVAFRKLRALVDGTAMVRSALVRE